MRHSRIDYYAPVVAVRVHDHRRFSKRRLGRILHHPDFNAHNTLDSPNTIVPKAHAVELAGGVLKIDLPPLAIVTVTALLG